MVFNYYLEGSDENKVKHIVYIERLKRCVVASEGKLRVRVFDRQKEVMAVYFVDHNSADIAIGLKDMHILEIDNITGRGVNVFINTEERLL